MNEILIQNSYFYFSPLPQEFPLVLVQGDTDFSPKTYISPEKVRLIYKLLASVGVLMLVVYFLPKIIAPVFGEGNLVLETNQTVVSQTSRNLEYQPTYDANLPHGSFLTIPKIGVKTELYEDQPENYEDALKKGVWRVEDYGTPLERQLPTILVAHRFGYLKWSNSFRREHSFYNLPKLEAGDIVEITWRQRAYKYEIVATSEGTEIENIDADLILYTCRDLVSDVRVFKYARLLTI